MKKLPLGKLSKNNFAQLNTYCYEKTLSNITIPDTDIIW